MMIEAFPPDWSASPVAECMSAIIDYRGKTPKKSPIGIPLITAKIVKGGRILDVSEFIPPEDYDSWMRRGLPEPGDVVVTTEAPLGEVAQLDGRKVALAQRIVTLRGQHDVLDNDYLKFAMQSAFVQGQMLARATGTTVVGIKQRELRQVLIPLPPLEEQRAIASVLGSLDDKIELNRRMNRTLEQMAAAIFKAWFVDFEPVRAKASGAASFPGMPQPVFDALPATFADSELGPIPEGWEAGCIGDIGKNRRDGIQPSEIDAETPYIGLEHMPKRCIALDAWDGAGKVTSGKSEFSRGEILFGKLRPYFHKVGVAPIDGVCSTDVLVVKPKARHWSALLLGHLSSLDFVNYTDACSTGTKMPRTNWKDMARYPIAIPSEPLAAEATRIIEPMIETILSNIHESRTLAETRDALLPKLLSGEVRAVASMEEEALA